MNFNVSDITSLTHQEETNRHNAAMKQNVKCKTTTPPQTPPSIVHVEGAEGRIPIESASSFKSTSLNACAKVAPSMSPTLPLPEAISPLQNSVTSPETVATKGAVICVIYSS